MKTIKAFDIKKVEAEAIRPGMILAHGIVAQVRSTSKGFLFDTPDAVVYADQGEQVQVYGRLADDLVPTYAEAVLAPMQRDA